jgi:beta-lactam-binding protein with PASTA domain
VVVFWPRRFGLEIEVRPLLKRLVQYTGLGLALLVTGAASAVTTMRIVLASREVRVPSVLHRRVADAGAIAARSSLALRVDGKRYDPRVPAEHVVAQEPPPGSSLRTHRSIRILVSLGPRRLNIPNVRGTSARTAHLTLEQSGAPVSRVIEIADSSPEGTVLLQEPSPGEIDSAEEGVSLLVSQGPGVAFYVMPDLIGRNAESVLDALRLRGLKVTELRYRNYPGVAPGIVLRQVPPAGHRVSTRDPVALDVSKES